MDGIVNVLHFAIDGLSQRQDAIADNLANVQTPGYTAHEVTFEQSLQQAISSTTGGTATIGVADSSAPATSNGNDVDTGQQLVDATKTQLQYQTMVQLLDAQITLVKDAVGDGSAGGIA